MKDTTCSPTFCVSTKSEVMTGLWGSAWTGVATAGVEPVMMVQVNAVNNFFFESEKIHITGKLTD